MNTKKFLKQKLNAVAEEIPVLLEIATDALEGVTESSVEEEKEQLWRYLNYPYYLGLFARDVIDAKGVSDRVKERLCHAVLQANLQLDASQEPGPGVFRFAAWLGEHDKLTRDDYLGFRKGIIWLPRLTDNYAEQPEHILPACKGVFRDTTVSRDECVELILMVLTAKEAIGENSRQIFDFLMNLPSLSDSIKKEVCEVVVEKAIPFPRGEYDHPLETNAEEQDRLSIRFLPGDVRRRAVVWLSRLDEDTIELLDHLLKPSTVRGYGGDFVASGALDLLNEAWEDIDEETREKLLKKAASLPDTSVRKRAYILGEKYLGFDFLEQSLDDKAKSLRQWARKRLEKRENDGAPSPEELQSELEEPLEE